MALTAGRFEGARPSFFRPRTLPADTWPALPTPAASQVWAAYLQLDRTQWLSHAEIEQLQLAQLRKLVEHAIKNVPYYRRLFAAERITADAIQTMHDFRRIPLLERRTYQEQFLHMSAGSLPEGTARLGVVRTSGTSGVPIEVLQTNVTNLWWLAYLMRDTEWCGIDPRGELAAIRVSGKTGDDLTRMLEGVSVPVWSKPLDAVIETGSAHIMDVHQDPRRQLEWLRKVEPSFLLSYPSNLEFLAGLVAEDGRRIPSLRVIQSIAETLTDDLQARIESAFGVPVRNTYSCFEAGYVASPCPLGHGLHVHAENVIIEVLDAGGSPCSEGQTGRVVLTTLHNFLTPFIRYDIMDEAEVGPDSCACGRGLPLLRRVSGKARPVLHLPDGRVKNSAALAIGVRKLGGCHQFQVIQAARDRFVVRIVPNRDWTGEHPVRLKAIFFEFCASPVSVDLELMDRLPLPPGGKLLDFACEVPRPSASDAAAR
jgi:phenylacetate-CoA ligase